MWDQYEYRGFVRWNLNSPIITTVANAKKNTAAMAQLSKKEQAEIEVQRKEGQEIQNLRTQCLWIPLKLSLTFKVPKTS